jgi:hypothetical protein
MAAARIAAVFFALLCAEVSAQPAPQGNVTVQVTDMTGAVVPGARVDIDPSPPKPESVVTTDNLGQAILDIPDGAYSLSVSAPGFNKTILKIDVKGGAGQSIMAALKILSYSGPTVVVEGPETPMETPEPVFIPLQPLLNLGPLPLKNVKRRWWWGNRRQTGHSIMMGLV